MTRQYTVIKTSGWVRDSWRLHSIHYSRKEALAEAARIYTPDSRLDGHITAVVGRVHTCPVHEFCELADTSRVRIMDRQLRSRRCHIDARELTTK